MYIIDAKNYLPHITSNLPRTSDINKQILYRYFLSKEFNESNKYALRDIKNVFLLPNDIGETTIRKVGFHKLSNVDSTMGNIAIYQVDYDSVINSYIASGNKIKTKILIEIDKD